MSDKIISYIASPILYWGLLSFVYIIIKGICASSLISHKIETRTKYKIMAYLIVLILLVIPSIWLEGFIKKDFGNIQVHFLKMYISLIIPSFIGIYSAFNDVKKMQTEERERIRIRITMNRSDIRW